MGIILNIDLPAGWSKEKGPKGQTIYYNEIDDEVTLEHPMAMFLR